MQVFADNDILRRRAGFVDNEHLGIEGGAVFGIGLAVEPDVGADIVFGANLAPPGIEGRPVCRHALSHDRHQTAARLQALQSLFDVPRAVHGVTAALDPPSGGREWRVHHDHGGFHLIGKDVVQLLGVFAIEGIERQVAQDREAPRREFIDRDGLHAGNLRKDCKTADSGRRFEEGIGASHVGGPCRQIGEVRRGRELLELVHFLGALALGRDQGKHFLGASDLVARLRERDGRIADLPVEKVAVDAQFHGIIGVLRRVGALRLAATEGLIGRLEQVLPRNFLAFAQAGQHPIGNHRLGRAISGNRNGSRFGFGGRNGFV